MGQKSALYNSTTGAIMGYYDSVDSPLPATLPGGSASLEITDAEWQAGLSSKYQPTVVSGVYTTPSGPTLAQAQATQKGILTSGCQAAIVGGFTSSALGSVYNYPSDPVSQSNQNSAASSPSGGKLWCESGGVWGLVAHTQAQAQAVVASLVTWVNSCQEQRSNLTAKVAVAKTLADVMDIKWVNP